MSSIHYVLLLQVNDHDRLRQLNSPTLRWSLQTTIKIAWSLPISEYKFYTNKTLSPGHYYPALITNLYIINTHLPYLYCHVALANLIHQIHPNTAVSLNYCQPSTVETPHQYHKSFNIGSQTPMSQLSPPKHQPTIKTTLQPLHLSMPWMQSHRVLQLHHWLNSDIIKFASSIIYNPVQSLEAAHSRAKPTKVKNHQREWVRAKVIEIAKWIKYHTMLKVAREKCSLQDWTMRLF